MQGLEGWKERGYDVITFYFQKTKKYEITQVLLYSFSSSSVKLHQSKNKK